MKNNIFNYSVANIYEKPSAKVAISSQILYGERFKIISKKRGWLKIKTNFDNYVGFIKERKFDQNLKPTHKIYKLKTRIFKKKKGKFLSTNNFLYFASSISIKNQKKKFC